MNLQSPHSSIMFMVMCFRSDFYPPVGSSDGTDEWPGEFRVVLSLHYRYMG